MLAAFFRGVENVGVENEDLAERIQDMRQRMRGGRILGVREANGEAPCQMDLENAEIPEDPPVSLQYMSGCAATTACLNRSRSTACDLVPEAT